MFSIFFFVATEHKLNFSQPHCATIIQTIYVHVSEKKKNNIDLILPTNERSVLSAHQRKGRQ